MPARRDRATRQRRHWWSSARLRIVLGISLTTLVVFAVVALMVFQLLRISEQRETNQVIERKVEDVISYVQSGAGDLASSGSGSTSAILRAFLTQQYPQDDQVMIATAIPSGTQMTLAKNDADSDPYFSPDDRRELLRIAAESPEPSGITDAGIRWAKVTVAGDDASEDASLLVAQSAVSSHNSIREVMQLVLFALAVGLVVTALLSWVLAGWVLSPVRRVRHSTQRISAEDLSRRVPVVGGDEFVELALTVNAMLDRVENAYNTQREFLNDAGHELRTPLTVVQGYLDILPEDPAERRETLHLVQDELSRMTRIVEDLLVLARSRRPDFLRRAATSLEELVLEVELKAEVVADRVWDVRPEAAEIVSLDRQRITQALLQFASNAVRYTEPGTRIEIGCRVFPEHAQLPLGLPSPDDGELIHFWVRDHGHGIP
uniref:sensor histidine kinase n=1 Tax=Dietzia sp. TaxID=1871616 RepID=UPI002FDA208C